MEKSQLQELFSRPFDRTAWQQVLIDVFGVTEIRHEPRQLENQSNDKVDGFEVGRLDTSDGYHIGIYEFEIKTGHKIAMNRVGLRGLVKGLVKYQDDAALVVFHNKEQWRLSFICDLKDSKTAPKRFTYVFGDEEKSYRTPVSRFEYIKSKGASKEVIHEAFSVEALNKDFYKFIAGRFYELVGATTGAGKNKTEYKRIMRLPGEQDNLVYQEFAVRLIGRTVFCWFLKEKKSKDGVPLLPHSLLSSKALNEYNDYYHTVLERIFFQTLNTPNTNKDRVKGLPKGCELIPFLNGGLFDYRPHDFYTPEDDGLSKYLNELQIPDEWFKLLFEELEQYNFTIDENSPDDIEVSVDPEMLGRIFENLLAEIDPDSGETARKATGSFYTPREIVDYMAVESLVYYLNRKTGIDKDDIYPLFKSTGTAEFSTTQRENLLVALDELKILDPACGSGAFPMGVLAKITGALQVLDKDAVWWKKRQIERIENAAVRQAMQEKFDTATVEYARKIGIIQNTLYGVDIQPIAAEISKLRCFLTLIVDENVDDTKSNRGVEPLPNLEFKFITADSLLKLPPVSDFGGLFGRDSAYELTEKLRQLRIDYLQSYGKEKTRIKRDYLTTLFQLCSSHSADSGVDKKSREYLISEWNPFTNDKSDWFDPEWMFGVAGGFDIVIGNPPYGASLTKEKVLEYKKQYKIKTSETAIMFVERGLSLLSSSGTQSFIIPKSFAYASNYATLRDYVKEPLELLVDCGKAFERVKLEACIILLNKKSVNHNYKNVLFEDYEFKNIGNIEKKYKDVFGLYLNGVIEDEISIGLKIINQSRQGQSVFRNSRGDLLQKYIVDDGDVPVIGGKEIDRFGMRKPKGYIPSTIQVSPKSQIHPNSVLAQNIVAHITKPYDQIKIIACIGDNIDCIISDTINQLTISESKYSNRYLWALLNSKLICWYTYLFVMGKAIRTMHFDSVVTDRVPIKDTEQQMFIEKVDEILTIKAANPATDTSALESEIDQMVYDLYGLTHEEIAIIERNLELHYYGK